MKKKFTKTPAEKLNDHPKMVEFSTTPFRKQNKKRILLPDAFEPRWELELFSSFIAIIILWMLPDWIIHINTFLLSKYAIDVNSTWTEIAGTIIIASFIFSIILRVGWICLVWKWHYNRSSRGHQMFRNAPTREMRIKSYRIKKLAIITDDVTELVFFIFSILLFVVLLGYTLQIFGHLLNHSLFKPWGRPEII